MEAKICKICEESKPIDEFKDGKCRECKLEYHRNYYKKNKSKLKENMKKYWNDNKEELKQKQREYRLENIEQYRERDKKYYEDNKEVILDCGKEYRKINKKSISEQKKEYYKNNREKIRKQKREYMSRRRNGDDKLFILKESVSGLIYHSIRKMGYEKNSRTHEILGCSFGEFLIHIESKLDTWMTWSNKGLYNGELNHGWDIDHIIPISSAKTEDEVINLNHYTNLQPLCSKVNRDIKNDKW